MNFASPVLANPAVVARAVRFNDDIFGRVVIVVGWPSVAVCEVVAAHNPSETIVVGQCESNSPFVLLAVLYSWRQKIRECVRQHAKI